MAGLRSAGLLLTTLLLSALPVGALAQSASPGVAPVGPAGIDWHLTHVAGSGVPLIEVPAGVDATLRIDGAQAGGQGGCNSWFGSVKIDGDAIAFDGLGSTMMACPEPKMGFETQYLGFLPSVAHWSIADSTLTLTDAGGATLLIFSGQASSVQLEGVDWLAVSVLQDGAMTANPADIGTTLTLTDGQATGSTGCNRYFGGYTLSGTSLTFAPLASTEMACPEPRMAIESAWLTALGLVTGWSVDGDQLHLLDAAGNDLAVLAPAVATGVVGTWTLGEIAQGGTIAMIMSDASVTFGEDGSLTGNTGCNNLMSDYAVDGDSIKIGPVATTKMACKDPSVASIETALLAALEGATGWHTSIDGWLELTDATGAVLAGFVPGTVAVN
jgi:heat shock protein HslJ